jgi:DNA-binding SARP family transcriptional activator
VKTIQHALIRVRTLGQNVIEVGSASIRPDAEVIFATLLVLCAERGRRVEREAIIDLLWPRESVARRKHNLRQVLYKIRQLGVDTGAARETVSIAKGDVWLDFEDATARDARQAVKDLGPALARIPGARSLPPRVTPRDEVALRALTKR